MIPDLLKIQNGDVYIQIPVNDVEAVNLVIDVLKWHVERVKKKQRLVEKEETK